MEKNIIEFYKLVKNKIAISSVHENQCSINCRYLKKYEDKGQASCNLFHNNLFSRYDEVLRAHNCLMFFNKNSEDK